MLIKFNKTAYGSSVQVSTGFAIVDDDTMRSVMQTYDVGTALEGLLKIAYEAGKKGEGFDVRISDDFAMTHKAICRFCGEEFETGTTSSFGTEMRVICPCCYSVTKADRVQQDSVAPKAEDSESVF